MSTSGMFVLLCLRLSCRKEFEAGEHRRTRFRSGKLAGGLESFRRFARDVLWGISDAAKAMVRSLRGSEGTAGTTTGVRALESMANPEINPFDLSRTVIRGRVDREPQCDKHLSP